MKNLLIYIAIFVPKDCFSEKKYFFVENSRFFGMHLYKLTASQRKKETGGKTDEKRMEQRGQKIDAVRGAKQIAVQNYIADAIGNLRKVQRNMADLVKNN